MMLAIKRAREHGVPFLGICLGFQLAVVEWARNVLKVPGNAGNNGLLVFLLTDISAQSTEFDENASHPLIVYMPEVSRTHMGGTMRLGLRPTVFESGTEEWSKTRKLYGGAPKIWERHRHRYEVNPDFVEKLVASGLPFIGRDEKGERMQIFELEGTSMHYHFESPACHLTYLF